MRGNFANCLPHILRHEGGWADNPKDPGGATMKGITIGTFADWRGRKVTKAELRAISDSEVAAIYKQNYWDKVRGDDLPAGLDLVAFDAAVNSGVSRGARWLQQAVGAAADGKVGPETVRLANAFPGGAAIVTATALRLQFLRGLKTWATFGGGWQRRVDEVRSAALAMVENRPAPVENRPAPPAIEIPFTQPTLWQWLVAFFTGKGA
jgi:lysozyme family protein